MPPARAEGLPRRAQAPEGTHVGESGRMKSAGIDDAFHVADIIGPRPIEREVIRGHLRWLSRQP